MMSLSRMKDVGWECVHFTDAFDHASSFELLDGNVEVARVVAPAPETLLRDIGTALRFPSYYGANWDALEECLKDLDEWLPARAYVLVVEDSSRLWSQGPLVAGKLVEVWLSAAESWARQDVSFHLIFVV